MQYKLALSNDWVQTFITVRARKKLYAFWTTINQPIKLQKSFLTQVLLPSKFGALIHQWA